MERCGRALTLLALLAVVATAITVATSSEARAATLHSRLVAARHALHIAKVHLAKDKADLAAALAAQAVAPATGVVATPSPTDTPASTPTPTPTDSAIPLPTASPTPSPSATPLSPAQLAALKAAIARDQRRVKGWQKLVASLARQVRLEAQLAGWARRGQWRPFIKVIAARYHVSSAGLYNMMMLESGGRRCAGSGGMFLGLFQYYPGTWRGSWNPWRHSSIFDGGAQIRATALAVHRGMGPQWWPNTYPRSF